MTIIFLCTTTHVQMTGDTCLPFFFFWLFLSGVVTADFQFSVSSVTSTSAMSSFTTYIKLLFGLPRFLFPGNSILSILLPIYLPPFLRICPYYLSLASHVFSPNRPTCGSAVNLMYAFLILFIIVTPNENRNVSATLFNPYNIAILTSTLYTFPFTLAVADHF